MLTFIFLYLFFYYITLIFFFFYLLVLNLPKTYLQLSISELWQTLSLYDSKFWIFKLLILQLSGMPPMFFFFLKLNFIVSFLLHAGFIVQAIIFINVLLGTFFYLKLLTIHRSKVYNNNLKFINKNNSILLNACLKNSRIKYNFWLSLLSFLSFNFFSFVFFFDIYTYSNLFF